MEPQFGSGSQLLGGTTALQQAMQSRGVDSSVLNQVGGNSPIAQPMPQPPQSVGGMPPQAGQAMQPQGQSQTPSNPLQMGTSESEIILKALSKRLEHNSNLESAQTGV